MDHLPLPREPLLRSIIVPYYCTEPYDGGPMLNYPARHGWEVLYSPFGISYLINGEEPTDGQLIPFIQNWLYFGYLQEIFGPLVNIQNFIKEDENGTKTVTAAPLEDCAVKWTSQLELRKEAEDTAGKRALHDASEIIEHVWKVSLGSKKGSKTQDSRGEREIWLSIAALAEVVEQTFLNVYDDGPILSWRSGGNVRFGDFIIEEMELNGWCPFDVKRINYNTKSVSTLYYLANLQPPRADLDHSSCTGEICTAMQIGSSYKTKHTTEDCKCDEISDVGAVIMALKGKNIPLVQAVDTIMEDGQSTNSPFKFIDSDNVVDFVAISHVWAEGLGNPHGNSLPSCSLQWVSDLASDLAKEEELPSPDLGSRPMPFWIDTLCVPIQPKEMHTVAMNRLRIPYQNNQHVLVLDSYLYTQNSTDLTASEIWCRVLCCTWSQRLWTFQEGRLAHTLWFQFADRAVLMHKIMLDRKELLCAERFVRDTTTAYRGSNVMRSMTGLLPPELIAAYRPVPDVRDMRESLKSRAVSFASDEALCLFGAMHLDLELVTELAPEERMPKFWSLVKKIPLGLVFSTAAKKLTVPGLRWAPASFMGDVESRHWYIEQALTPRVDGFPTPDGLQIQAPGFMFDPALLLWDDSFDICFTDVKFNVRDENGEWYFIETFGAWNQTRTHYPKEDSQLAMLLVDTLPKRTESSIANPFHFQPGLQVVIGVVTGDEDGDGIPRFEAYRHARLNRYSVAHQELYSSVHDFVEVFVEGACRKSGHLALDWLTGTITEDSDDTSSNPDDPNYKYGDVTPETFRLTQHAREFCEDVATQFAMKNPRARGCALAHGRVEMGAAFTEESAFKMYAHHARFQLQMRLRNRITSFPQTQTWCID